MTRRDDDFPADVVRTLKDRAGNKCSVCHKSTSGPGASDDTAQSDGVAAHITAASPRGPRYDGSLSPEGRRGIENAIWGCTQHGREIDSQSSDYSEPALRALKRIREDMARRELQNSTTRTDGSAVLIELPYADTADKLVEIIAPQEYTFETTSSVRTIVRATSRGKRLLELVPEVIIGAWDIHPNVAGILATLLSASLATWEPKSSLLSKLEQLCSRAITSDEWPRVALVEPVAFAVAAKGHPDPQRQVLRRLVNPTKWRKQDAARQKKYYGSVGAEIAAVIRHWDHHYRTGLLRAHDVGRLMDLMFSESLLLKSPDAKSRLIRLLEAHAQVLADNGERELARAATDFVQALRLRHVASA